MKVVKNASFGGFGLSRLALIRLSELTGRPLFECNVADWWDDESRTAPELVQVVEELGSSVNGFASNLVVVEIPDDVKWYIRSHDGMETIEEVHRSW